MRSHLRKKLVAVSVAVAITGLGGVALAAGATRGHIQTEPPTSSDQSARAHDGTSDSSGMSDASEGSEASDPSGIEAPEVDDQSESAASDHAGGAGKVKGEHPDNHGAAVSKAAHECPPGQGHGACVSAVAHQK